MTKYIKIKRDISTFNHPTAVVGIIVFRVKTIFKGKKPARDVISTNTTIATGLHAYSSWVGFLISGGDIRTHACTVWACSSRKVIVYAEIVKTEMR